MAPTPLVDRVRELSRELSRVARLLPDEDPLNPGKGKKNASSFLFEIKVLLKLLSALKVLGWKITAERRGGRIRFVRAPARKSTGSFFRISKEARGFQLTQGTKVTDRHDHGRAPDISLQNESAGEDPTFRDLGAIWDAKLQGVTGLISEERISDNEFRGFAMVRKWLAPPMPGKDPLEDWPPAFSVSAIISNGRRPTEPVGVLLEAAVSVVEKFQDASTPAWPERRAHIEEQARRRRSRKRKRIGIFTGYGYFIP